MALKVDPIMNWREALITLDLSSSTFSSYDDADTIMAAVELLRSSNVPLQEVTEAIGDIMAHGDLRQLTAKDIRFAVERSFHVDLQHSKTGFCRLVKVIATHLVKEGVIAAPSCASNSSNSSRRPNTVEPSQDVHDIPNMTVNISPGSNRSWDVACGENETSCVSAVARLEGRSRRADKAVSRSHAVTPSNRRITNDCVCIMGPLSDNFCFVWSDSETKLDTDCNVNGTNKQHQANSNMFKKTQDASDGLENQDEGPSMGDASQPCRQFHRSSRGGRPCALHNKQSRCGGSLKSKVAIGTRMASPECGRIDVEVDVEIFGAGLLPQTAELARKSREDRGHSPECAVPPTGIRHATTSKLQAASFSRSDDSSSRGNGNVSRGRRLRRGGRAADSQDQSVRIPETGQAVKKPRLKQTKSETAHRHQRPQPSNSHSGNDLSGRRMAKCQARRGSRLPEVNPSGSSGFSKPKRASKHLVKESKTSTIKPFTQQRQPWNQQSLLPWPYAALKEAFSEKLFAVFNDIKEEDHATEQEFLLLQNSFSDSVIVEASSFANSFSVKEYENSDLIMDAYRQESGVAPESWLTAENLVNLLHCRVPSCYEIKCFEKDEFPEFYETQQTKDTIISHVD